MIIRHQCQTHQHVKTDWLLFLIVLISFSHREKGAVRSFVPRGRELLPFFHKQEMHDQVTVVRRISGNWDNASSMSVFPSVFSKASLLFSLATWMFSLLHCNKDDNIWHTNWWIYGKAFILKCLMASKKFISRIHIDI